MILLIVLASIVVYLIVGAVVGIPVGRIAYLVQDDARQRHERKYRYVKFSEYNASPSEVARGWYTATVPLWPLALVALIMYAAWHVTVLPGRLLSPSLLVPRAIRVRDAVKRIAQLERELGITR